MPIDPKSQAKFRLIAERNCQLVDKLKKNIAVMQALKSFIRRRIEAKKVPAHVR
jgi:hypothetical protein